jgi:hypothetical protein
MSQALPRASRTARGLSTGMRRVEPKPVCTVRLTTDQPRCAVFFEPIGSDYELTPEDAVLIHVYGRATRPEDADVEVHHGVDSMSVWLPDEYCAWNKAGKRVAP